MPTTFRREDRDSIFFDPPRATLFLRNASLYAVPDDPMAVNLPFRPWTTVKEFRHGLAEHRKSRISRSLKKKRYWENVKAYLLQQIHHSSHEGLTEDCDKIYALAREISTLSELPSEVKNKADETAFLLLHLYMEDDKSTPSTLSKRLQSQLKEYFGKLEPKLQNRMAHLFSSFLHWLNPEQLTIFKRKINLWKNGKSSSDEEEDDNKMFPFGRVKLKRLNPKDCGIEDDNLAFQELATVPQFPPKELTEDEKVMALFTLDKFAGCENSEPAERPSADFAASSSSSGKPEWDRTYLLNLVGNQDLLEALINILTSGKSNDEIQEQLFDLLGYEKLDTIAQMLENRSTIMRHLNKEEALAIAVRNQVTASSSTQSHPVIGVKIQSAQEKILEKMYRKEEKKAAKTGSTLMGMTPSPAVTQMEIAAGNSMRSMIRQNYVGTNTQEELPNVYDDFTTAKQKAGFISGVKIVLPENMTRTQTHDHEEVNIPLEGKTIPARAAAKPLIKISELDPMAQEVFRGMATLNRIQSLVYETAYKTNENLLICAPTGAGKTNIALLTIVNCIQNNMEGGTIRRDAFKIVYVAPMKALAAEMTANFSKRLSPLGVLVRELTGDMQLTKAEITQTQVLVTTPEKWDVVTRKSTGDVALAQIVQLLIIDEVHLLHGDRGPVVESLVARTLRQVESSQRMIRIVGLSATLPNYRDVAQFLRVNPRVGLFYFDSRFRPVPLSQCFIGVKAIGIMDQQRQMDQCCYDKVYQMVAKGHQVMVFVHARNATVKTAEILIELAIKAGQLEQFMFKGTEDSRADYGKALKSLERSRNKKIGELFQSGFSVHHAGLLRTDRTLIEKLFSEGFVRVLVCTATLAWGVNLPAHAVIIKGTEIYDSKQGAFVDLGILDVLQIFGRAGRPQFDKEGHGTIITTHDKLSHYLQLLTNQFPIESNFIKFLADNLNAEIALGSVSNIEEAVTWLTYTYLYIRMRRNPQMYGMQYAEAQDDPLLTIRRKELIVESAKCLEKARMIRFDQRTEYLYSTDLGRTASHFYVKYDTVETFNEIIHPVMAMDSILMMITKASEFEQLKVRDEEMDELDDLTKENCWLKVWGGAEHVHGKVSILLQTYISRGFIKSFSLMSDQQYVIQNAIRICRAFFEVVLRQSNPLLTSRLLEFSKMLDQQLWDVAHPLKQHKLLSPEILEKLEKNNLSLEYLRELPADEIGALIKHSKMGAVVKRCAEEFPLLDAQVSIQPITRNVLRLRIILIPDFKWNDRLHGNVSESFWIWVEDPENNYMYHHEYFLITKRQVIRNEQQELVFTIPITEPLPPQYYVRIVSDRFLGSNQTFPVSFKHLILPEQHPPHTDLLDLDPLPVSALGDINFQQLYPFHFFNPIQTQIFHCLYHTDSNALVGAPTGSGKTIAAEMAMFRVFKKYPSTKVVYIAPMKALVRERVKDWKLRLEGRLGKRVVELTGDVTPDVRAITNADVIVTTPEKWDGISRSWQTRSYVQAVSLIIIDEIHLLGEDRGPVLEVIVSRTNFISQHTQRKLRIVGLSTALANARDLANWLGIKGFEGLFNFRPSVRPVPIQVHIQGFPGKHYCPRMATMNKPTFQAIREHSPSKPTLVFVSSRRQTRLTALDLIAYLAAEGNPKQWMHVDENEMEQIISTVKEPNLKLTLAFGIGIHHAGLQEHDRKTVEELFVNERIQVLIATATLAWGVNFPAHLVVIKGTEYFDGKTSRYVDMPITDVLQMMGRAGRPQFDTSGVAVVLVHDQKKNFYKKFLYEPFPVESSLVEVLPDHLNAEIVAGTISSNQEALDYLTCTYFFRRLVQNPTYYHMESNDLGDVNTFLSNLISKAFLALEMASCIFIHDDLRTVEPTSFGRIAGYYYLSHQTMHHFRNSLSGSLTLEGCLEVLTDVTEYKELPVRHNEDTLNEELAKSCPVEVAAGTYNSPHTKAHLLLQCHYSRLQLPSSDYYTDLKSVMDQVLRILQAMIDACAENGWLASTLHCVNLIQMTVQARWLKDDAFLSLPYVDEMMSAALVRCFGVDTLPELQEKTRADTSAFEACLLPLLDHPQQLQTIYRVLEQLPIVTVRFEILIEERRINMPFGRGANKTWVDLPAGKTITLIVHLNRENEFPRDGKAYAPRFAKPKDEGWFLILGDVENRDLLALKRGGGIKRKLQQQLEFRTPDVPGRVIYTLYLMCDAYLGLDQQYDLHFNVKKNANPEATTTTCTAPPPGFQKLLEE